MKKLFFAVLGVAFLAGNVVAQDYDKNIYGVRVGLNAAKLTAGDDGHSTTKPGFHIGGVYERLLMPSKPLYLETGLNLTLKGSGGTMSDVRLSALYVEIPIMVNYKFYAGEHWVFYPSAGFYYALGVGGTCDANFLGANDFYTVDSFGRMAFSSGLILVCGLLEPCNGGVSLYHWDMNLDLSMWDRI